MRRGLVLSSLLLVLVLTACGGSSAAAPDAQQPIETPVQLSLEDAEGVGTTFLAAWQNRHYEDMYSLVAFRSREATPQEDFVAVYENAAQQMTLDHLDFTINASLRQGNTVAISYDVAFTTSFLGDFEDTGRTLRLVVTDEGWRVAWSSADIFPEMAGGGNLILSRFLPTRANIYDRDDRVLVNQSGVAIQVEVVQEDIPNEDACFETLTRVLRLSNKELTDIYASRAPNWVTLVGEIDAPTYGIESQELIDNCAATFGERATRRYVSGGLAPHVTGYVGYPTPDMLPELALRGVPEDGVIGITGIERSWDSTLGGQAGGRLQIISPVGDVLRTLAEVPAGRSESIYLTINSNLQFAVQQTLSDAYNVANWANVARGAAAVVMDVHTGEILALASYPWFDPNLFNPENARFDAGDRLVELQNNVRNPQINRVTQSAFAPGSTFKIATMIAVADSGTYTLDHSYVCSGTWYGSQLGDINRGDWLTTGHGQVNLRQALTGSCDPYFYQAGYDMNQSDSSLFSNYVMRLGFGASTGLNDLPENPGQVPSPAWKRQSQGQVWTTADAVNMAIGQGELLVTPLQMVRLVAAVANGGQLVRPHLVLKAQVIGEDPSYQMEPSSQSLGIRPEVLQAVQDGMCQVPTNVSLGTAEYVFGSSSSLGQAEFTLCGKTGTAQTGGETTPPHAWFVAYSPAEDPQIAIAVMVENSREGSEVAAPIVRRILEAYYGLNDPAYPPAWWPPSWWEGEYIPLTAPGA